MNKNINSIELYNIKKSYDDDIPALKIKKLIIPFSGIVVIMGYSGSGKTTFVNILGLIDVPDMDFEEGKKPKIIFNLSEDEIYTITYYNNKIVARDNKNNILNEVDIRAKIFGYIFQKPYMHDNFTVNQNIQTPLIIENSQCDEKSIEKSLEFLNLSKNKKNEYPDNLSGGEAQRTSILRGIIKNSNILIADEPTSSLDIINSKHILSFLRHQVDTKNKDKIIIWVSHDIHLISRYAKGILVLSGGKLVYEEVRENPGIENEHKISSFLSTKDSLKEEDISFSFSKIKLNIWDKTKYIFGYAYRGLFKKNLNPTFDFKIGATSIIMTLLFLLFIAKINHSMNTLLTFKLNNPSINNFSVIAKGGSNELSKKDVLFIKNKFIKDVKSVSPVYLAPIDIKNNNLDLEDITESDYVAGFRFVTFEKNDPILASILSKDSFLKNKKRALQTVNNDNINALVVQKRVLEELEYDTKQNKLSIRLDTFTKEVNIHTIDSILPNNVDGMLRSELYFKAYFGENITQQPSMSHIIIYPKDIKKSIELSYKISKQGNYSISNFYALKTKIETILDINKMIDIFSKTISFALIFLSIAFIYLTLYRSIERKRKEIGVFLANGISRLYFSLFYATQAFMYFSVTSIISLVVYYFLIDNNINSFLVENSYLKANYGDIGIIKNSLLLPIKEVSYILGTYFIFIHSLFLFMINKFISQKPVDLMKD
jgi:putative ABC transport system ATP-binding protein